MPETPATPGEGLPSASNSAAALENDQPLVSVVVPTRNRAEVLRDAIDSILGQTYKNIECIVVDALSTDNTIEVLRSYGDRIRWLSEADRGAFEAIDKGWKLCQGEVMTWLNSDDRWTPDAVETAVRIFKEEPDVDVVYGDCGAIDERGRLLDVFPAQPWDFTNAVMYCDHIINQAASFMRRRILEDVGYLYPAWCHDHDLWLRIALAGGRFKAVHHRLADARIWDENLGFDRDIVVPAKIGITERIFEHPDMPREMRKFRRRAMSNTYLKASTYLKVNSMDDWLLGLSLWFRALAMDPFNLPFLASVVSEALLRKAGLYGVAVQIGQVIRLGLEGRGTVGRAVLPTAIIGASYAYARRHRQELSFSVQIDASITSLPFLLALIAARVGVTNGHASKDPSLSGDGQLRLHNDQGVPAELALEPSEDRLR